MSQPGRFTGWARGAYKSHTDQSKGAGVTGVWDQTASTDAEMPGLHRAIGANQGNVASVDLHLDQRYVQEDHEARAQIGHRRNLNDAAFLRTGNPDHLREVPRRQRLKHWRKLMEERSNNRSRALKRRTSSKRQSSPEGREALPWGGQKPGDPDGGWGQNHPLYWRRAFRKDDEEGSAGAVS
jgi:hypothetical protein